MDRSAGTGTNAEVRAPEARLAELAEEIRAYPTPIAGCDAQLAGFLEERALIQAALRDLHEDKA